MTTKVTQKYKHIVWSADLRNLDFSHPATRRWWLTTVLREGMASDIAALDYAGVREALPSLYLPPKVKRLWEFYFDGETPMTKKILTEIQSEILTVFGETEGAEQFYLSGGTALANFYLRHRRSDDLDLFTGNEDMVSITTRAFEKKLAEAGFDVEVMLRTRSFVRLLASRGGETVKAELAHDTPYRLAPLRSSEYGVNIDSLEDIAANKMLALFGRAAPRDFVDVYFLVQEHFDFSELMTMARQKDTGFDEYWLAIALRQIEDVEDLPVTMLVPLDTEDLKAFFGREARKIMRRIEREGKDRGTRQVGK